MPAADIILQQLAYAAERFAPLAIAWHIVLYAAIAALLAGWRPSRIVFRFAIVVAALSVAFVAAAVGNAFNAVSFSALAIILATSARGRPMDLPHPWQSWLAVALVAFGAWYPHFIAGSWVHVFYASPFGVVPCPTLAVVAGFALLAGSRPQVLALALWTAFYAAFGVVSLGVHVDLALAVASVALMVRTLVSPSVHSTVHG